MSERINKYLSAHGVCSRREADRMIQEGRITIDGRIAVMGEMVEDNTIICVDGRKVDNTTPPQVVIAFNKPVGIVCTTTDKQGKNNIVDFIGYKERIYPVGRLDKESDGLMLLTNDGDNRYMPNKQIVDVVLVFKFRLNLHWNLNDDFRYRFFHTFIIYKSLQNIGIVLQHRTDQIIYFHTFYPHTL